MSLLKALRARIPLAAAVGGALTFRFAALGISAGLVSLGACRPAFDYPVHPPERVVIKVAPAGARAGAPLTTQPVVEVIGPDDELLTDRQGLTVLAVADGATISQGAEEPVVNGVATFTRLTLVGRVAPNVTLRFVVKEGGLQKNESYAEAPAIALSEGPPAGISIVGQSVITGEPGARVIPNPAVIVLDAGQNPLRDVPVTFEVISGNGRVEGGSQVTDAAGRAQVGGWVLGLPGPNQLQISVSPTIRTAITANVTTTSGMLRVLVTGLPSTVPARLRVLKTSTAGTAYDQTHDVRDSVTLTNLPFGTYTVSSDSARSGERVWAPAGVIQNVVVSETSGPRVTLPFNETARVEVTVRGLPQPDLVAPIDFVPAAGTTADRFTFFGRNDAVVRRTVPAGTFDATPQNVTVNGQVYTPTPTTQRVVLAGGDQTTSLTVNYTVSTGILTVLLTGLPANASGAQIDITGPNNFRETVFLTTGRSWPGLRPGSYTVTASTVTVGTTTYRPEPASTTVEITAGSENRTTIRYAP